MRHLKKINENLKMPSIFQEVKGYEVDVSDLADFIKEKYGKSPEIEASLEMGHDETREIFADDSSYSPDEDDEFYQWLESPDHSYGEICMLMNKLAFDGHIESATYYIKTY
jgi:hypothetical protein